LGKYHSPSIRFAKQQIPLSVSGIEPKFLACQARRLSNTLSTKEREGERGGEEEEEEETYETQADAKCIKKFEADTASNSV
jgi:hypothetical protein